MNATTTKTIVQELDEEGNVLSETVTTVENKYHHNETTHKIGFNA